MYVFIFCLKYIFYFKFLSDTIRIPFVEGYLQLTNNSIQCTDQRSYDAKTILIM